MSVKEYLRVIRNIGFRLQTGLLLVVLHLAATIFEGFGIGMFLPIIDFLRTDGDTEALAEGSKIWQHLIGFFEYLGVKVTFASLLTVVFICFCMRQFFTFIRVAFASRALERLQRDTRRRMFSLFMSSKTAYQESVASGSLVNGLTTELNYAVDAIFVPPALIGYLCVALVYAGVVYIVSGPVVILALVLVSASGFLLRGIVRRTEKSGEMARHSMESQSTYLVERLSSMRLIRLCGSEELEWRTIRRHSQNYYRNTLGMRLYMALTDALMEPIGIGVFLILIYLGYNFAGIGLGELGVFFVILIRFLPVVKEVIAQIQGFIAFIEHVRSIDNRLTSMEKEKEDRAGTMPFPGVQKSINYIDVIFKYPNSAGPALNGLSFQIPAGRVTALVGPSGGGKSTTIDMLPRLRDCTDGKIMVDGIDLKDFDLDSLRGGIGYLPQAPQIFNVTAKEHIAYARPESSQKEILEAARDAGALEFIQRLPEGFDTSLGEDGVRLSGGQRQRLDLARALNQRSAIIVLDEPTSNLDAEAEEAFQNSLGRLQNLPNKTIIVIAHRLSTIRTADQIVVLREGRVDGVGKHQELIVNNDWYGMAYRRQSEAIIDEAGASSRQTNRKELGDANI